MNNLRQSIRYKDIDNWNVKNYLNSNIIKSNFSLIELGELITPRQEKVKKQDYKGDIELVKKISFKDGIIHIREERQSGMDMYKLYSDDLLVSKINFHQGALAINCFNNILLTSTHYQPYIVSNKVDKQYLVLTLRGQLFQNYLSFLKSDGIKTEATYNFIKTLKIPLPPLNIQQKLVKNYQNKLNLSKQQTEQAKQKEADIETYLYQELGIELPKEEKLNTNILQFVDFDSLSYWSVEKIHKNISILSNKYPIENIDNICSVITDGTHQTPTYTKDGVIFLSAKNVTKEVIDWSNVKYVSQKDHDNYCKRVQPSKGDILLAKNGTTGVAALVGENKIFSIYVSLAILRPILNKIDPNYFLILINSPILKKQFFLKLVGVGVPNLHLREIKEVKIPLPTLEIQNQIASHIQNIKNEIQALKQQAEQNQNDALNEFEAEIFTRQASIENNNAS